MFISEKNESLMSEQDGCGTQTARVCLSFRDSCARIERESQWGCHERSLGLPNFLARTIACRSYGNRHADYTPPVTSRVPGVVSWESMVAH